MVVRFLVGLDVGQVNDPTALVVLDRTAGGYDLRHLERLLGQPYPKVVSHVAGLMNRLDTTFPRSRIEITDGLYKEEPVALLAVDATGVGKAVVDMLREADMPVRLIPVTVTSGHDVNGDARTGFRVPKRDLVGCAQVLLQSRRLRIARELPLADTLVQELSTFKVKITAAANETFEAWHESQHDDLVFALALACWLGEGKAPLGGQFASGDGAIWPLAEDLAAATAPREPLTREEELGSIIHRFLAEDVW